MRHIELTLKMNQDGQELELPGRLTAGCQIMMITIINFSGGSSIHPQWPQEIITFKTFSDSIILLGLNTRDYI